MYNKSIGGINRFMDHPGYDTSDITPELHPSESEINISSQEHYVPYCSNLRRSMASCSSEANSPICKQVLILPEFKFEVPHFKVSPGQDRCKAELSQADKAQPTTLLENCSVRGSNSKAGVKTVEKIEPKKLKQPKLTRVLQLKMISTKSIQSIEVEREMAVVMETPTKANLKKSKAGKESHKPVCTYIDLSSH
mmetsp:Transcript_37903/g.43535  ORF Transcript_37903/g.43535 Transcript_37903/m.43535 type:complete len:194 (+) Transcript_37903:190-771(+)|eukprot:CAMPEP_0168337478 /NCGR_PEP_ID=MMETSP0213-20121227/12214_1 /TAXON_ID=151035 /ORGANISM="Euplotes harpa, Strain FSP1.4" /LENGTH=193 /DNA_ID=CAMNT_0008342975 /DNA_START=207 /DNA_END=788 /DNA_ORIENTATION=+